jgi:hypothetical protein
MNETELLLAIAEISVAFAGFASLASIFGRRSSPSEGCVDAGRVINMLTVSLTVTGLALFPFVLILLELLVHGTLLGGAGMLRFWSAVGQVSCCLHRRSYRSTDCERKPVFQRHRIVGLLPRIGYFLFHFNHLDKQPSEATDD